MRVAPNMTSLGDFEICNPADPDLIQTYPSAAFNGENYIVAWSDEKIGGVNYYSVCVARVTPAGAVLDTGVCISSGSGSSEYRPKVAYDGSRSLVVWPKSSSVQGRFVNNAGQPEGNILTIAAGGAGGPSIAYDGVNYLVVYQAGTWPNYNIYGQLVSSQGTLVGSQITIALDNNDTLRWPDIVFDGSDYLVIWMSGPNSPGPNFIHGQGVAIDGSLIGNNFLLSNNTSSMRWWPMLAASDSNYLVVWGQGSSDIWGNIDQGLVSIEEDIISRRNEMPFYTSTILSGPLDLPPGIEYRIYDISGRSIDANELKPGVYFIEIEGHIRLKVVKIR